jgi:hypothetical protein
MWVQVVTLLAPGNELKAGWVLGYTLRYIRVPALGIITGRGAASMDERKERITDGKALMDIVTGASWWDFNRDAVESEEDGVYVDRLYGKILYSLKNWNKFFDEDRKQTEMGLTMYLAEMKDIGYSLVAFVTTREPADPAGANRINAVLRVVKD